MDLVTVFKKNNAFIIIVFLSLLNLFSMLIIKLAARVEFMLLNDFIEKIISK